MRKIFLVEDDPNFGLVLKSYLELHDFEVEWIDDGAHAIEAFKMQQFHIVILDVMLPNVDGFEIAQQIRSYDTQIPFIFLTAKNQKTDMVKGYSLGADDYLQKPFDSEVLILKIKAILNRGERQISADSVLKIGIFDFDTHLRIIQHTDNEIRISPKEAELLKLLIEYKNTILPRNTALEKIWGSDNYFTTRSMDVYITKLRKYLKPDPNIKIENIHGTGFRLISSDSTQASIK